MPWLSRVRLLGAWRAMPWLGLGIAADSMHSMHTNVLEMSTEFFKPCQAPFLLKFPRTIIKP